ncbi:MAG: amidohydrolase family protein [Acidobacteria bacterium]|nr:amidohydrolase family protein [Acidobacteriota bacterium]MBV9478818.1 amidohydrolase family protein [Acidobacteriota bacterium]
MLVVTNADLYDPAPRGRTTIVAAGGRIEKIGELDARELARNLDCTIVDASGCIVTPGLIDPHTHLIGGSGEKGFASASAPIDASELLANGITTVAGLLGTDTTTKTLPALLARVKALRERGVNAHMWTGGYDARFLTTSVRDDIILIDEIIGAGEIAIADRRGAHFDARTLARLASDCYIAGTLTGKAGVLHLHTGELAEKLSIVRDVLAFGVPTATLYPTHVNRNDALFADAIALTRDGVTVDCDVVEEDLVRWLRAFDGDRTRLTISTDAPIGRVGALLEQLRAAMRDASWPREDVLALATRNPARVLNLRDAGVVAEGNRADLLLLDAQTYELRHTIAGGVLQ